MLKKTDVIKKFNEDEKEQVIKIYETMELAYNRDITIFSSFFSTPNIWSYFIENFKHFKIEVNGAFDESDRRIISFNNVYNMDYPYVILKISSNSKFCELFHRDYLGAIMALGVDRKKMGDLMVLEGYAIIPVYKEIANYLKDNLVSVGKAPVTIESISSENLPNAKYINETINIASLRLDNFVAKLAKISRTKAIEIINQGKVLLNYSKKNDKSTDVKEGQKLTISGVGKFKIGEIVGSTKSGRYKIDIKKYV